MIPRILVFAAALFAGAGCTSYEAWPLDPARERDAVAARGLSMEEPPSCLLAGDDFPVAAEVSLDDGITLAEANAIALFWAPPLVTARRACGIREAELLRAGLLPNPGLFAGPRFVRNGGTIVPASLSVRIPLGDRLGAENRLAGAELEAAQARLLDAEVTVLVDVRRRFLDISARDARCRILREIAEVNAEAAARSEDLLRGGETDRVAAGLAVLERDHARFDSRRAEGDALDARLAMLAAIGLLPDADIRIVPEPRLLDRADLPPADRDLVLRHSRLRALEATYRVREHGLELEVARQFPTLGIGPEFESDEGTPTIGFGVSMTLPIFNDNSGGIAVAEQTRAGGREAWQAALVDLTRREYTARARHTRARASLAELRAKTIPAAAAAERALQAQRRSGQTSFIQALAARGAIARARLREVELRHEAALRALEASWASGRLFPDGDDS